FAYGVGATFVRLGITDISQIDTNDFNVLMQILAPARMQVLWIEIAFWAGTILGIWAIVQGIIATVRNAGRGSGSAAIITAVVAPMVFFTVVMLMLTFGIAASAAQLYGMG